MKTLDLLAMDFGASNGRGVVGHFDGEQLCMEELHRFSNDYIWLNGSLYWDSLHLFTQIKTALAQFNKVYGRNLGGIGIDTWGVDYGLIDRNGQVCGFPFSYRMATDQDMRDVWEIIPQSELFEHTGIAANNFNTIYQLYARRCRGDVALQNADKMLLLPDLFAYFLSGEMGCEYTMATTTQLYNPNTRDWDWDVIARLGLPAKIFLPVQGSCQVRGNLLAQIADETGCNAAPVLAIGSHDTASAVAAVPGRDSFAFLSSGTWSLFGMESESPILTDAVLEANYSNEGTIQGGFRPLKNIMGLWIIQQCRREWLREGLDLSWDDIVAQARQAPALQFFIDPDDSSFFATQTMCESIRDYCRRSGQNTVPQSVGEIARCVYESLALKYRWALDRLEEIKGGKVDSLHIVGGGCQNKLLNQMAANAIARPVVAGPIEGACIGNLLGQAMALGEIASVPQLRDVVRNSFTVEEYQPQEAAAWSDAYERFLRLLYYAAK